MKHLRHLCVAVVLTLALACSAFADGQMSTGIGTLPPPSAHGEISTPVAGQISTGVAGQIEIPVAGQMPTLNNVAHPVDPATQMALSLLRSVLSLL
jgi:hypothetical protein